MSDYFHEQMINKMLEPKERDFPCKECWVLTMEEKRVSQYIAEDKAQRMLLKNAEIIQALEDVKAEIEAMYGVTDTCDGSLRIDKYEALESIECKIKEIRNEDTSVHNP